MAASTTAASSALTRHQSVPVCLPGRRAGCYRVAFATRLQPKDGHRLQLLHPGSRPVRSSHEPKVSLGASAAVVTSDSWERSILRSECPVLVEFYASWCGPCRMVHEVMDEMAREHEGKIKCYLLNTDHDLQLARDYQVKAVPVVMVFKGGERRESIIGTVPKSSYEAAIRRAVDS